MRSRKLVVGLVCHWENKGRYGCHIITALTPDRVYYKKYDIPDIEIGEEKVLCIDRRKFLQFHETNPDKCVHGNLRNVGKIIQ